jgi:SAM-dependent methyltransferase
MSTCPLCERPGRPLFAKGGYLIQGCMHCGHQWTAVSDAQEHVQRIYNDYYFHGDAAGYPDYLSEGSLLTARGRWYARLLRRFTEPGLMLDVGAAAGFILKGFTQTGWQGVGVEPNATMAEYARQTLGLHVHTGTLEQFHSTEQFDVISMIQVVAHFPEPRQAFARAAELTRPGGHWLIETWDRASWSAWLFGQSWHEYSPPSVVQWFSAAGLRRFARRFGFRYVASGRPRKCLSGAHAKALLASRVPGLPLGRRLEGMVALIPDRLTVPYYADDLFWVLFRKE